MILRLRHLPHKFLLISKRALARDKFKVFMKTGKIVKAAFITKLFNAKVVFDKQLTCMSDPKLDQKLGISFPRS